MKWSSLHSQPFSFQNIPDTDLFSAGVIPPYEVPRGQFPAFEHIAQVWDNYARPGGCLFDAIKYPHPVPLNRVLYDLFLPGDPGPAANLLKLLFRLERKRADMPFLAV